MLTVLGARVTTEALAAKAKSTSWFSTNNMNYGSPEHDKQDEALAGAEISADRLSLALCPTGFGQGEKWRVRIHYLHLMDTPGLFGDAPV